MSKSTDQHRRESPQSVRCAVITVSDTRSLEDDRGGALIVEMLARGGQEVVRREIVPDNPDVIGPLVQSLADENLADAILLTGGTGITERDQTYETIAGLLDKEMPGYGELFRMLSFEEIGAASMLSRTIGGVRGKTIVLTMPGSTNAVRLAMERLIVPELSHLVHEARK